MKWLISWWHALNRRTDMSTLWPACKEHAASLDTARAVFYFHAVNDRAWTDHYTEEELAKFVEGLN